MKNKFLLFFLALSMSVVAGERSAVDAAALAAQFMNQQVNAPARKASVGASAMQLSHTRMKLNSTEPAFYVFNQTNNNGYVVVSADDRTEDVLMYSDKSQLDVEKANPNLKFWLNRLQEEISAANDENTYTVAEKKARKAVTVTAISPLLVNDKGEEIAWYQEAPYWNQCPMDLWKTSERCLTGCVATAAAQIMYKWRHPEKGTGSHSYTWKCCMNSSCTKTSSQTLSKDFSKVTFDWDNMLPAYVGVSSTTAQKDAVATLMSCCGIACDMAYGGNTIGGSGAYTDVMGQGMVDYFGYKAEKFITTYSQKNYGTAVFSPAEYSVSSDKFKEYFNADLEAGRPVFMGGEDSDGGHEFVCDGRNTSGYFHINWGWEGDGNNYCLLTALKPSGSSYNFSSNIDAMIGLEPAEVDTVHVTGVTVAPTTLALKLTESSTLTATVAPTDATVKTVTWSSNNKNVATVSDAGLVTAVGVGSATITATTKEGNKKATCSVTVTKVDVTGITVSPATLTLKQKEKASVSATIVPAAASDKTYSWSSSNVAIATVSDAGQVVGVAQGQAWIIATANDGGYKDTCFVTVTEDTLEVTDCAKYSYEFTKKCTTGSNTLGAYTWDITLDAGSIGNIDSQYGKGQQLGSSNNPCGKASLTTANTAECLINTIKVNASMGKDGDAQLAIYIGGTQVGSTQSLTSTATEYTFSNTASLQGNLEIRLTNSAKAMYIKQIEVNPDGGEDPVAVTGVTLNKTTLSLGQGTSATLTATVAPANATNKNVTWSSSVETVATVDSTGVVKAVAEGSAVITVKTEDGNYTATCDVTVTSEPVQGKPFELVTKVATLKAGLEVLIVNIDASKAISTTQNANNRAAADVTIANNKITLSEPQAEVEIFTLKAGSETSTWAFSPSEGNYIYAASSSKNYLRTQEKLDANASFTISIESNIATIVAQGDNTHNEIRYNAGNEQSSPLFSCYTSTSTMSGVSIFARENPESGIDAVSKDASKISQKVLLDGQLYILYEGRLYNAQGIVVK